MDADGYLYVPSKDDSLRRFGAVTDPATDCPLCGPHSGAQWPMFQGDAQHTGQTIGAGHRTPVTAWASNDIPRTPRALKVMPNTAVLGPITAAHPAGVLFYTGSQYLIARDAESGEFLWAFDLGRRGIPSGGASPALLYTGLPNQEGLPEQAELVIVGAKDGVLYAININPNPNDLEDWGLNREVVWQIDLGGNISKSSPTIGPDGTIYIVEDASTDILHAVYWNGTRRWSQPLGPGTGTSSPTYWDADTPGDTSDDRVFVGAYKSIYAFEVATGEAVTGWPAQAPLGYVNTTSVVSGDNLSLYVLNNYGDLYHLNPAGGAQTPTLVYGDTVGAVGYGVAPAIQNDPYTGYDVMAITAGNRFYRVVLSGSSRVGTPQYQTLKSTAGTASPVIDNNGWMYALDNAGYLHAFYRYAADSWGAPMTVFIKKISVRGTKVGGITVGEGYYLEPDAYGWLYVPTTYYYLYGVAPR
jgi:hypothetical protein